MPATVKLEDSQCGYIDKRNVTYNQKYSILDYIFNEWKSSTNVIELFGGIGITSYFIRKHITPKLHTILEIHDDCIKELKARYPKLDIRKQSAFDFDEYSNYDYVLIDAGEFSQSKFYIKRFNTIFDKLKNYNPDMVVTDLGFWKFSFVKKEKWDVEVPKYFEAYQKLFKQYNFFIKKAYYTHDFSILYLTKLPVEIDIKKWDKTTHEWRNVLVKGGLF